MGSYTKKPVVDPIPEFTPYLKGQFNDTSEGQAALENKNNIYASLYGTYNPETGKYEGGYNPFTFSEADWKKNVDALLKAYPKFSYDVNSDALYQQYAEQYARMGKLAMQDTMGQAAAMTGGYGNSYAATVGNQAYQSYLQQLNDRVPELYQMALERYKMDKDDLYTQASYLSQKEAQERGVWEGGYNRLLEQLGMADDDYWNGRGAYNTEQSNANTVIGMENDDKMSIWNAETTEAWRGAEWDEAARQYAESQEVDTQKILQNVQNTVKNPTKKPTQTPTKDPETVKPKETANTTGFINSHMTSTEFMQRGGTSKHPSLQGGGGRSYAEYKEYIAGEIEKAWGDLTDAERAYLIQYYKL